jgi:hypothetical protein
VRLPIVLLRAPTGARISTDLSRVDRRIPYDRRERRMPVLERPRTHPEMPDTGRSRLAARIRRRATNSAL